MITIWKKKPKKEIVEPVQAPILKNSAQEMAEMAVVELEKSKLDLLFQTLTEIRIKAANGLVSYNKIIDYTTPSDNVSYLVNELKYRGYRIDVHRYGTSWNVAIRWGGPNE